MRLIPETNKQNRCFLFRFVYLEVADAGKMSESERASAIRYFQTRLIRREFRHETSFRETCFRLNSSRLNSIIICEREVAA